jgi:exosome complex component RRP45
MKDEVQALLQRDFALQALRSGVRVDGRALDAARIARIVLGPAHGQAHVTLGRTVALASATANPVTPFPDRPAEGTLVVSVEISATASEPAALEFAVHGAHPPADKAALALRGLVERVIRDSRAIDTEALCILAGKKVWAVSVDVALVDAAGNASDAVHLAAMAALLHARRNDVSISGTDVHVHPFSEREPLPLPIHHVPLIVSYALFAGSGSGATAEDIAALDPCLAEELASDGSLSIALNAHGEVCGLHKAGGQPIAPALVFRCAEFAAQRVIKLTKLLNEALHKSSMSHHPLAAVRPVLVAPEPSAMLSKHPPFVQYSGAAASAAMDVDDTSAAVHSRPFQGGLSSWNAIPVDEARPPIEPFEADDEKHDAPVPKPGSSAMAMDADNVVEQIFRSVGKPAANVKQLHNQQSAAAAKRATTSSNEDSSDSNDSDDDLLAAVIAKPKGGGARGKSKHKIAVGVKSSLRPSGGGASKKSKAKR